MMTQEVASCSTAGGPEDVYPAPVASISLEAEVKYLVICHEEEELELQIQLMDAQV
jgi:hypothetical protein